jgi:hypothetical protein
VHFRGACGFHPLEVIRSRMVDHEVEDGLMLWKKLK